MGGKLFGMNRGIVLVLIIAAIVVLGALAGPALFAGKGYAGLIVAAAVVFVIFPVVIVLAVRRLPGPPRE